MKYKIGDFEVFHLSAGTFALDGGAMFGVVPKVLWNRIIECDELNRIPMGTNVLVIKAGKELILVDTGIGNKWSDKLKKIYDINPKNAFEGLDFGPEDITKVVLTHLHFDHAGGTTVYNQYMELVPAFPNATYYVQEEEWTWATHPNERTKASYLQENILPLKERIELLDGDTEIAKGVRVVKTGGHTAGHEIVVFESNGEFGVFLGDLVPMSHHVPLPYIMAYDNFPMDTLEKKKELYIEFLKNDYTLFFEHDRIPTAGKLLFIDGKYSLEKINP